MYAVKVKARSYVPLVSRLLSMCFLCLTCQPINRSQLRIYKIEASMTKKVLSHVLFIQLYQSQTVYPEKDLGKVHFRGAENVNEQVKSKDQGRSSQIIYIVNYSLKTVVTCIYAWIIVYIPTYLDCLPCMLADTHTNANHKTLTGNNLILHKDPDNT